tara:strand:+ start:7556 stop:8767 length:1212 start_codon:yes stop_codon:yes gene_type:complete
MPASQYFKALDSWRGIAACLVATLHFPGYSHLIDFPFIRNSWLWVDFFFILSGFIIATKYQKPLSEGFSVTRFMLLRIGRLLPLYFFLMFVIFGLEALHWLVDISIYDGNSNAFPNSTYNLFNLVANFSLAAGLGIPNTATFLTTAWSINAEFYTYLIFSIIVIKLHKKYWIAILLSILIAPIYILYANLNEVGPRNLAGPVWFIRCIYSFSFGVLLSNIIPKFRNSFAEVLKNKNLFTLAEVISCCLIIIFISVVNYNYAYGYILAPYFFAPLILIFSLESGAISKFLIHKPFLYLGKLSYSIYLVHWPFYDTLKAFTMLAKKTFGVEFFTSFEKIKTLDLVLWPKLLMGTELWQGDLFYVFAITTVIFLSGLTFKYIETPTRSRFKKFIARTYSHKSKFHS